MRRPGRVERVVAVVSGLLSLVVVVAIAVTAPPSPGLAVSVPGPATPTPERGDPVLAEQLAQQARRVAATDPQRALRLLLAAHVVAPDEASHRVELAQAVLGGLVPRRVIRTLLPGAGPITYAVLSADASFLVTGRSTGAQVWQTRTVAGPAAVFPAGGLGSPVTAAAGAGTLDDTTLVSTGPGGASVWRAVDLLSALPAGHITDTADAVAITTDGATAVTVNATAASLWNVRDLDPTASATFTYDLPVTALAFAPGAAVVLAAGHPDGGVTIHTINLAAATAKKTELTGTGTAIDAVAVSADASTVAAVHQDGTLTQWRLRGKAAGTAVASVVAAGPGPHRIWLGPTGDYAFVADTTSPPALWSLVTPGTPTRIRDLELGSEPAVPAMISTDGRTVASIDRDSVLQVWDVGSMVDVLADPVGRACQLASMTEQQWRQMVVNTTVANPCAGPTPPTLGVDK